MHAAETHPPSAPPERPRILFVDDDVHILDALKRLMRPRRKVWDMSFAEGWEAGMNAALDHSFDVVVSDLSMPGGSGVDLLSRLREERPEVVRILLSGSFATEMAIEAIPVAHQFVSKPLTREELNSVLLRACGLRPLMNGDMRAVVGGMTNLPSVPEVYRELCQIIGDPDASLRDIAAIVERDPAITARILHIVNSAFLITAERRSSVLDAVKRLGTDLLKSLVAAAGVMQAFEGRNAASSFSLKTSQALMMETARIAQAIAGTSCHADDIFTAAILHGIGDLVVATELPDAYDKITDEVKSSGRPRAEVEREILGVCSGQVGGYLLGLWGLPVEVVEGVAYHQCPLVAPGGSSDVLLAVHVAAGIAAGEDAGLIDMTFLERCGVSDRLEGWKSVASDLEDQD